MYNKITLIGQLVATPEIRHTTAGVSVTSFSIAVERRFKVPGERRKADFFNIVCWRHDAEFVCANFVKGDTILVEGEMQTHRHTDKNGNKQTWYEVLADCVAFTSARKSDSTSPVITEQDE